MGHGGVRAGERAFHPPGLIFGLLPPYLPTSPLHAPNSPPHVPHSPRMFDKKRLHGVIDQLRVFETAEWVSFFAERFCDLVHLFLYLLWRVAHLPE